jgi:ABC-type dipeptide/oligopeptide/nickel transport system permease subunit
MSATLAASGRWSAPELAAIAVVGLVLALALLGGAIAPLDPLAQDLTALNQPPGAGHLLGTDHIGRDVLARLAAGARLTLLTGVGGALIAFLLGAGLALVSLALGDPLRTFVYGGFDLLRALPGILVAILLVAALSPGPGAVVLALGLTFAPTVAEVVRAAFGRESAADYVAAARVFGLSRLEVTARHILPNITGTLLTMAAIILPRCIVTESVLSFLGLGGSPSIPSWGRMIADAAEFAEEAPHAVAVPVLALSLFTLALSLVGGRIRRMADPLQRAGAAR